MIKGKINMRKRIQHTVCFLWAILTMTSCIMKDEDLPDCPEVVVKEPIEVTASLYCNDKHIEWPDSSHIGILMLEGGTNIPVEAGGMKEYRLVDKLTKLFIPAVSVNPINRPEIGATQDATGVYPYGTKVNDRMEVSFSVADQSNQQALDLITAKRTVNITHETDTVHLDFYRRLSRMLFTLSLTEVAANGTRKNMDTKLAGAKIEIVGMHTSALFSLNEQKFTTSASGLIRAYMQADAKSGQAIVFPREAGKGITFKITLPLYPDTTYIYAMDSELEFTSCKSYKFDIPMEYKIKPTDPTPPIDPPIDPEPPIDPTPPIDPPVDPIPPVDPPVDPDLPAPPPVDPLPETPPTHPDTESPDLDVLRADIIDWVENYTIDGGILTPIGN